MQSAPSMSNHISSRSCPKATCTDVAVHPVALGLIRVVGVGSAVGVRSVEACAEECGVNHRWVAVGRAGKPLAPSSSGAVCVRLPVSARRGGVVTVLLVSVGGLEHRRSR